MKTLTSHINEALKIGKNLSKFSTYSCRPTSRDELIEIIYERIKEEGPNCDLNDIDVSLVKDMSFMFIQSIFNGDISKWDVSSVKNMSGMFFRARFNRDISKWDVHNVENMSSMFAHTKDFNKPIGDWDVSNVKDMTNMFYSASFNQDISKWKLRKDCNVNDLFYRCPIKEEFKPKSLQK